MKEILIITASLSIRPSTLLRFHQYLVRRKYQALFTPKTRSKPGPKGPSESDPGDCRAQAPQPALRLPTHRIDYLADVWHGDRQECRSPGSDQTLLLHLGRQRPSWLTFLGQMKDSLWSVDLFRCESVTLKSPWVLVVMDHFTRRIIGFGVHAGNVNGVVPCRMFNGILGGATPPRYLSSDNDPLFTYHQWQANLRILDTTEVKSVPSTPVSHPFVERLIGTVRREFLDHLLFWTAIDLAQKLREFQHDYNAERVHASLGGTTPTEFGGEAGRKRAKLAGFEWNAHCRGMVQLPIAA